jgi:hypothetical protein
MAREASYRILDEPGPSALGHLVVHPMWPLLSIMFAGAWLSIPWFIVNGIALGSHSRLKELAVAVGGLVGVVALGFGLEQLHWRLELAQGAIPYLRLVVVLWKLGITYWLFNLQKNTFALHEYFSGKVRNGMLVVAAGFLLRGTVLKAFGNSGLWHLLAG